MYSKVFRSIYDGTLADNWQALVTFQQLLILADGDGVVDMTIGAIHRTTGIPVDVLTKGIEVLEAPDRGSRTPDMEGRRIARIDAHRDWGWFLVNWDKYRKMTTREEKKEADRVRIQEQRNAQKAKQTNDVAECSGVSQGVADCSAASQVSQNVADVAYTDTDTEKRKSTRASGDAPGARFDEFWSGYPRSDGKKPARDVWVRRKFDHVADRIIADVRRRIAEGAWREVRYIPHATTYLNQERWNDGAPSKDIASAAPDAPAATDLDFLHQVAK